jgi:molecular chaperone HtpG
VQQDSYIQAAQKKGFKVVKMETLVDAAFINNIELKWENVQFTRVDADIANNLIDKDENADTLLSKEQEQTLKDLFGKEVTQPNIKVDMKGLTADVQPVIVTRPEFMRRMKDMASMGGGMNWYANMPDEINMTINANHPVYLQILREKDGALQQKQIKNLADLALLSQNLLTGADLTAFVNRSVELMTKEDEA